MFSGKKIVFRESGFIYIKLKAQYMNIKIIFFYNLIFKIND